MILFLFFPENRIWQFMQIVSTGDNLHETSKLVFCEKNQKNISVCCPLKILPRVLRVKIKKNFEQMSLGDYFKAKIIYIFSEFFIKNLQRLIHLNCLHEETLHPLLFKMHPVKIRIRLRIYPVKIQIRLRKCAIWSESSLGTPGIKYVFWSYSPYSHLALEYPDKYHIYPKYRDTLSTYHTCPKIWNSSFYYLLMCLKYC